MKKSTIWILGIVMAFSFLSLIFLQVRYIEEMIKMRNEQFDESVRRSLYRVSKHAELSETEKWLMKDIAESNRQIYVDSPGKSEELSISQQITVRGADGRSYSALEIQSKPIATAPKNKLELPNKSGAKSIPQTSRSLAETIKNRYVYQRSLLDDVVWQLINQASERNISDRVDFQQLDNYLKAELINNGIPLLYHFQVVDRGGTEIYRCSDYEEKGNDRIYAQPLFPNDPPVRMSFIKVHFPDRKDYIYESVNFMIPSTIFSAVLLITFIFTLIAITRQKKLTEMKNDFIDNMTHELKTPISSISLAAQMLKDPAIAKSPTMFGHISKVINDETKRLQFLVEKVLQMSMFERQRTTLKMREIDANDLLGGVISTFSLKVEQYGGRIDYDLNAEDVDVFVDEMHFTNVIFNLMDNAVKYRNKEVDLILTVKTWNSADKLMISIADNGIGIKKEDIKKVFDKFYRVHTGNLHDVKGFGLGLAYVKKIIDEHHGTIKVESDLNVGTKFIIALPLIKK